VQIVFSNRYEILRERLLEGLGDERLGPFQAQQVVVPSIAITRDLQRALAIRDGVCANVEFSFLAQWLWREISHYLPVAQQSPFAQEVLAWRVFESLSDPDFVSTQPVLAPYLAKINPAQRFDFANQTARLFEQYITYRPDLLQAWSMATAAPTDPSTQAKTHPSTRAKTQTTKVRGPAHAHAGWQRALWRRIAEQTGATHEHPASAFLQVLPARTRDPKAVHVFALPALPPLYLQALRGLSSVLQVHLYVVNPCQEFWFDVVDPKRLTRLQMNARAHHHETGNRLLAAWGQQNQAALTSLLNNETPTETLEMAFAATGKTTLLARLQDAILCLEEPSQTPRPEADQSLQIHICHGLRRELEVLHDQLLALFAEEPTRRPDEVLVVTPNLIAAAPLIDAVFGTTREPERLPYRITGLPQRRVNPIARSLCLLLALGDRRYTASEVFGLLSQAPVMAKFGLDLDALETIRVWFEVSGFRWGLDADQRQSVGLTTEPRHSLSDSLQRLLIGYAMGPEVFGTRQGVGDFPQEQAPLLGTLWQFFERLRHYQEKWSCEQTASVWCDCLRSALADFVAYEEPWRDDYQAVWRCLHELHEHLQQAEYTAKFPLSVFVRALNERLEEGAQGATPSGQITFAAIPGLRYLPYRYLFVVGLNDGEFPRPQTHLEFDLMAAQPRAGDRQIGLEDRNQFLDLFLATRERLSLSYTGRHPRSNARLPPSVMVADLLDQIERTWPGLAKQITIEHPLQDFERYAESESFQSVGSIVYEAPAQQAVPVAAPEELEGKGEGKGDGKSDVEGESDVEVEVEGESEDDLEDSAPSLGTRFFDAPLPAAEARWHPVSLDQLQAFFQNPARYFLRHRLGIELKSNDEELNDEEPFELLGSARRALVERLTPSAIAGASASELERLALAGTELSSGALGELQAQREIRDLRHWANTVRAYREDAIVNPLDLHLSVPIDGEHWQLRGTLTDVRPDGLVRGSFESAHASVYLSNWIEHLFLCAAKEPPVDAQTRWLGRATGFRLRAVPNAREQLEGLVRLYARGLSEPLRFFPKSAWARVSQGRMGAAHQEWRSHSRRPFGEDRNAAFQLAFRGIANPLDRVFETLAEQIFRPLLNALDGPEALHGADTPAGLPSLDQSETHAKGVRA